MNMSAPLSLDNFAKSCEIVGISKTIFPYERYSDIVEMIAETTFPSYSTFSSSLGKIFNEDHIEEFVKIVMEKVTSQEWPNIKLVH